MSSYSASALRSLLLTATGKDQCRPVSSMARTMKDITTGRKG
jgi:hypothetical protein